MKKIFGDSLIITGVTFLLIVFIEISLRLVYPNKIYRDTQGEFVIEYDKDYLYKLKPNLKKTFYRHNSNGGDTIIWRTNSRGFRGNEIIKKPDKRIIVYGNSNILALFSSLENTFPNKLQSYLSMTTDSKIEVLNAGVFGFGPDQSFIKMKNQIDRLKPDIIVFHIFADNDFGDIIRNRLFSINEENNLSKKIIPRDTVIKSQKHSFLSSLLILKATNKISGIILKNKKEKEAKLYDQLCKDEYNNYTNDVRYEIDLADHYDFDLSVNPLQESSITKIELLGAIVKELNKFVKTKNVKLVVLIQPSMVDLIESENRLDFTFLERNFLHYKKKNLINFVEEICIENKIDFINLYNTFSSNDPEKLYFNLDNHWNDLGQDLAAKKTSEYFINNNLW